MTSIKSQATTAMTTIEQLSATIDTFLQQKTEDPTDFYVLLSSTVLNPDEYSSFLKSFLPRLDYLYEEHILQKDLVYLSLLASENFTVLEKFIEYEKSVYKLDVEDPRSIFDYLFFHNRHFVYEIVDTCDRFEGNLYSNELHCKLLLLKIVQLTNAHFVDVHLIHKLLTQISNKSHQPFDEFWRFYVEQIGCAVDIVLFCINFDEEIVNKQHTNHHDIFNFALNNTLLETVSSFVNLKNTESWDQVLDKLNEEQECVTFTAFIILATMLNLIQGNALNNEINNTVDKIKTKLLHVPEKNLQIELLENIFVLLFLRNKNDFVCKEKEIRLILFLLKSVVDELFLKKVYSDKDSEELKKLNTLNIYLVDTVWRLDLIASVKDIAEFDDQILTYMLARPESLIHICLKAGNYERACQVIEIFNIRDSEIAQEINYAANLMKFKVSLKKNAQVSKSIEEFAKSNPPAYSIELYDNISRLSGRFKQISDFHANNAEYFTLFDFAITQNVLKGDRESVIKLAKKNACFSSTGTSNYFNFCRKILDVSTEINSKDDITTSEILISPNYPLDPDSYKIKEDFYKNLEILYDNFCKELSNTEPGVLNRYHPSHKTYLKINAACNDFMEAVLNQKCNNEYLLKVFNYLQAFTKILYIELNTSDIVARGKSCSYFELFNFNRAELTGKLLFEKHLDPVEFEKYFGKLKLDFLYHVVGNCFPTVNLHVQEDVTIEELYHDNMMYIPSPSIIAYIQKRNWLLAFILNEMYNVDGFKIEISEIRLRSFFNYLRLPKMEYLKAVFDDNLIVAALQNCINAQRVKLYVQERIVKQDLISIDSQTSVNSNSSFETAEEILEDIKTTNWKGLYDVIESIPESQLRKKYEMIKSKNHILSNIVQDGFEPDYYKYGHFICDRVLRIETILNNFKRWPAKHALELIRCEISKFHSVSDGKTEVLEKWLRQIELHEQLKLIFDLKTWYKSYDHCKKEPVAALKKILETDKIDILLDFIELRAPDYEVLINIESNYITKIIELSVPFVKVKTLLDHLPFHHTINICNNLLTILKNLEYLQFVASYLNNNVSDDIFLKNVQVGLKILSAFTPPEQEQLFCLISQPMNILELLLMNTKFDKLATVLELLDLENSSNSYDSSVIGVDRVDELLRKYAEKSLDFRVIPQPPPKPMKTYECKLLESLDSVTLGSDKKPFVMPDAVATKDEWVANEEVSECMCCHLIAFSMFNRRHHCRRCGRVVCYNCSLKRMLVPTYGDILVRVCSDCYEQTVGHSCSSEKSDVPSNRSFSQEYWLLNDDPEHNKIMREEFSYEHAPSTSLCLSILKYHSDSAQHLKFLLEQCEVMLKLLRPSQETYEIDYLLVIKMLKSLAITAKVLSAEHMFSSGASSADQILSQAELLALLVERGCLNLMPVLGSQSSYVDASVLRRLRDKLLQREQWNLALEVSTKAGLDNTGVFAAWGKSCLKAGSLVLAREKFQKCFERNCPYETSLSNISRLSELNQSTESLNLGRSRFSSRISNISASSESRHSKDPQLLYEIIQILETKTRTVHPEIILNQAKNIKTSGSVTSLNKLPTFTVKTDTAITVLNKIKNLQQIASGNFTITENTEVELKIDPVFYEECLFYLSNYGTHLSLLEFFIKHGDIDSALMSILNYGMNSEVFIEIYMKCLKDGIVTKFQEAMSRIDSSLDFWKNYLKHLCRHLEKQNLLNCLYQLQLYIGDYMRAAMACVKFYQENAKNFSELSNNVAWLHKAEEHLNQMMEQEQWIEVMSVGSASNESKDSFQEKTLANPDLVMKFDSRAVDKYVVAVKRQIEVAEFLAKKETEGVNTTDLVKELVTSSGSPSSVDQKIQIPTFFGDVSEKTHLAVLVLTAGQNVDDGFLLATKLIQDFKLRAVKVYSSAGNLFAKFERYNSITQLVNCIKSTEANNVTVTDTLDEMLTQAVGTLIKANVPGTKVEEVIKLIKDRATRISAFIEAKQLKTAYFLAVKYRRTADIRRIQREAELLNIPSIRTLCVKYLQNQPQSPSHSKDS